MSDNDDVRRRLQWLRREHPDAELTTEHVRLDDTTAIFRVAIVLPSGGKASGYGSEKAKDFGDFVERAETRAISRALDALGYASVLAAEARSEPADRVDETISTARAVEHVRTRAAPAEEIRVPVAPPPTAPLPREMPVVATAPAQPASVEVAPPAPPTPEPPVSPPPAPPVSPPSVPPVSPTPAPPIDFVASRDRAAGLTAVTSPATEVAPPTRLAPAAPMPTPATAPASNDHEPEPTPTEAAPVAPVAAPEPPAAAAAAEPALEDYSFTVFWRWARGLGYNSKGAIEDLIGRPIKDLTPLEVRNLVLVARGEA